ncbi:hypothetical protein CYMTET_55154 [Cymbomonas tetramitiformis]|uniref:Uncharacterized protein n=1 Tax=Cymbomonas tetramitiformis TaxID=36881 RepID=A0AAE0BEP8_9CHLO|nr:hypothetical protein CYMTET_55154 [Cymbomonas tetramitiformis]
MLNAPCNCRSQQSPLGCEEDAAPRKREARRSRSRSRSWTRSRSPTPNHTYARGRDASRSPDNDSQYSVDISPNEHRVAEWLVSDAITTDCVIAKSRGADFDTFDAENVFYVFHVKGAGDCPVAHRIIHGMVERYGNEDDCPWQSRRSQEEILRIFGMCEDLWDKTVKRRLLRVSHWICASTDTQGNNIFHLLCSLGFQKVLEWLTAPYGCLRRVHLASSLWAQQNSHGIVPLQEAIRHDRCTTVRFVMQELDAGAYEPFTVCNKFHFLLTYALSTANALTVSAVSEGCSEGIRCSANFHTLLQVCRDALFAHDKDAVRKLLQADTFFKVRHVISGALLPFDPVREIADRIMKCGDILDVEAEFEILELLIDHFNNTNSLLDKALPLREMKDANKRVSDELIYQVIDHGDHLRLFTTLVKGLPDLRVDASASRMIKFEEIRLGAFQSLAKSKERPQISGYISSWKLGHHSPWD